MWSHCLSSCWNLVDVATQHCLCAKHCSQKASTCLPPSSVAWLICHDIEKRPWQGSPSLAFPPLAISMRVCARPHLTSQSSSRCSCPSIHSSISSLLCRSFLLYFTVSLPSLRCAGSSVLSTVWNITLDWVPGSDAIAATASGVFSPAHTRAQRGSLADSGTFVSQSPALSQVFLCAAAPMCVFCYRVFVLPLSLMLPLVLCLPLSLVISLPYSSSCNTHFSCTIRRMVMRYASVYKCVCSFICLHVYVCVCVLQHACLLFALLYYCSGRT